MHFPWLHPKHQDDFNVIYKQIQEAIRYVRTHPNEQGYQKLEVSKAFPRSFRLWAADRKIYLMMPWKHPINHRLDAVLITQYWLERREAKPGEHSPYYQELMIIHIDRRA